MWSVSFVSDQITAVVAHWLHLCWFLCLCWHAIVGILHLDFRAWPLSGPDFTESYNVIEQNRATRTTSWTSWTWNYRSTHWIVLNLKQGSLLVQTCHIRFPSACQDVYLIGPPCQPYSKLNCKRGQQNPFELPGGEVFLVSARQIRILVAIMVADLC